MAAYARRVDEGFLDGIGFSEHYEFWPGSDACGFLDEKAYLDEVDRWRARGYHFHPGVEADWMPEYEAVIRDHLGRFPFAFVIGSVHNLPSASVSGRDVAPFTGPEVFGLILEEYHAQVASSLAVPEFDVVGHIGVYARHLDEGFFAGTGWKARIADLEDDLARQVAGSGKLLEVNTSGLFTARNQACAGEFFLERYRHHGGRHLTLGSDAHAATHLRRGFAQAAAVLENLGFDRVFLPWDREHPVPIKEYL